MLFALHTFWLQHNTSAGGFKNHITDYLSDSKTSFTYFDQDATLHKNIQTTNFQLYILDIKHNIPDFWRRTMLELYSLDGFKFTLPPGRESMVKQ